MISTVLPTYKYSILNFALTDGIGFVLLFIMVNNGLFFTIDPTGPYQIGINDLVLKGKKKTPSIFILYPTDISGYDEKVQSEKHTVSVLQDAQGAIDGAALAGSTVAGSSDRHPLILSLVPQSPALFKPIVEDMYYSRIQAVVDAPLHKDFKDSDLKLTPVIMSIGWASSKSYYANSARYLASYG